MAKGYRPVVRDQPFLLPPDMREWLPADHPVWLVIRVVEQHLDTSALHARRKTGGAGAAGYDPVMLLTLLVWAYAHDVTSSRRAEALCRADVAFRVICAGDAPDHVTIARFRQQFPDLVEDLFTAVLVLCARLGMGKVGTVALDGTKIAANASMRANRTEAGLRKLAAERAAAHAAADAAEDARYGAARGDEVPPEAADEGTRDARIARALADLEAERAAREAKARKYTGAAAAGTPEPGRPPQAAAEEAARIRLEREKTAQQARIDEWQARAAVAGRKTGRRPVPPGQSARVRRAAGKLEEARARAARAAARPAGREPAPVRNITDPDSRVMAVRGGGLIQGYNAQNVTSADGLIIATTLTSDPNDYAWYEPMITGAVTAAATMAACQPPAAGGSPVPGTAADPPASPPAGQIGLVLADAGYCTGHNLTCPGPDRLIATGKHRTLEKAARAARTSPPAAPPGAASPAIAAMTARLATDEGITAYRQRSHIAETPHGHIKHNMGFRQLTMRGKTNAAAEWAFTATIHNLFKAITSGHLTHTALGTLAPHPS
jgi:transposase